jgi:hypothetical protein
MPETLAQLRGRRDFLIRARRRRTAAGREATAASLRAIQGEIDQLEPKHPRVVNSDAEQAAALLAYIPDYEPLAERLRRGAGTYALSSDDIALLTLAACVADAPAAAVIEGLIESLEEGKV